MPRKDCKHIKEKKVEFSQYVVGSRSSPTLIPQDDDSEGGGLRGDERNGPAAGVMTVQAALKAGANPEQATAELEERAALYTPEICRELSAARGKLNEILVALYFDGEVVGQDIHPFDVLLSDGTRVEVKTTHAGSSPTFNKKLNFDVCVYVEVSNDGKPIHASMIPVDILREAAETESNSTGSKYRMYIRRKTFFRIAFQYRDEDLTNALKFTLARIRQDGIL
jgi:hypothetical protein